MKRLLILLMIVVVTWCAVTARVEALSEELYDIISWYEKGSDARDFAFRVMFMQKSSYSQDKELNDKTLTHIGNVKLVCLSNGKKLAESLDSIRIESDDGAVYVVIEGQSSSELFEYPKSGKRTLLSDFLNEKTVEEAAAKLQRIVDEHGFTEEACELIKAELEKEYTPAWVLPTAICGGAVVLAAAVAVPTVILRRKKRKAAAAAATDASTSDEDEPA